MARKAGVISINLNAGTAQFMADMDAAGAKVREFKSHSVSEAKATAAGMKVLEGQFFNNAKAADGFVESILGAGPILQKAFPVIAAAGFAGMIGELTMKTVEFFKTIQEAPERIGGAFREIAAPIHLANDELAVANDRLENDIAKLEGHHENTLKLALDEARVAADRLADSLDKDLSSLHKLLEEQNVSFWRQVAGEAKSKDIQEEIGGKTGTGGFRGRVAQINEAGDEELSKAKTLGEQAKVREDTNKALARAYAMEMAWVAEQLRVSKSLEEQRAKGPVFNKESGLFEGMQGDQAAIDDQSARIELLQGVQRQLQFEVAGIRSQSSNAALTSRKSELEGIAANAELGKPFEERMKALGAQIEQAKSKLEAIGKSDSAQVLAKAFGEGQKAIVEVERALDRHNVHLTEAQKQQIMGAEKTLAAAEAEGEWKTKLEGSSASIEGRIKSQELLTAAIGKGIDAVRSANVEARLAQELAQHGADTEWMDAHAGDVERLRSQFAREFDAERASASGQAVDHLNDQIELERELAGAQAEGAEAVRQAGFAVKLRQMTAAGATKEQIQGEMELFNAQKLNASGADVERINQSIAGTQRLTAALLQGAEATRKAGLEEKYREIRRSGDTPSMVPGLGGMGQRELAARQADAVGNNQRVTEAALRTATAYKTQVENLDLEIAALEKIRAAGLHSIEIETAIRNLENQRLTALAQMSLQLRGARDGVRAFFIEMQRDAKSAAESIYESLHSALDRTSANVAKLMTGQKTDWAREFQEIGGQMAEDSVKSLAQKGLGALGKKFGIDLGAAKPDGTHQNPIWVRVVPGTGGLGIPGVDVGSIAGGSDDSDGGGKGLKGLFGEGSTGGFIFSMLGKAFGGNRAGGGGVEPGSAYMVGEDGPEIFAPSTRGRIIPSGGWSGGGMVVNNHIDARGADLGAWNRIQRGMEMVHRSAVTTAVQVGHERAARVPGGR